ncbi:MAG: phospho-sugar mutase [Leptospiraceae bacterium]|nr:phospho-sugar mutase [Leptospiraceae bacterium]MDW8306015.1 phospho-sugar mutase [Leptospiraceae bacterium]
MDLQESAFQRAQEWLRLLPLDKEKQEIQEILRDENKLQEHFGGTLQFGTAGMRAIMGIGSARINNYTVAQAALGLARYLGRGRVVLAFDARKNSCNFAQLCAKILKNRNFEVIFFPEPTPTPLVPFALREKFADFGIVITASHNPPQYNGIKVYSSIGAQIIPPIDKEIAQHIAKISLEECVAAYQEKAQDIEDGFSSVREIKERYLKFISEEVLSPDFNELKKRTIARFVYTPLHGSAGPIMVEVLQKCKLESLAIYVTSQMEPNGEFPTIKAPNPEHRENLHEALLQAKRERAELIIANDGDGDRLGVMLRKDNDDYEFLNGNELGVLLAYYLLLRQKDKLTKKELFISSVVSSPLLAKLARHFGIHHRETLTGFKWMGNLAWQLEERENLKLVFAYEEAFGYALCGERDKDGISSALLLIEAFLYCQSRQQSLFSLLEELYRLVGFHTEGSLQLDFLPSEGLKKTTLIMDKLRQNPPIEILGENIAVAYDFEKQKRFANGREEPLTGFSQENLLIWRSHTYWLAIRPSGTEPKIKAYYGVSYPPDLPLALAREKAPKELALLQKQAAKLLSL